MAFLGVPGGRGAMARLWRVLVGPPLRARDLSREQITPVEGLPALSLDALTSVAYGPEAIIVVLAVAGARAPPPGPPLTPTTSLLPPGDRRLPERRRRVRGVAGQPRSPGQLGRRRRAGH